MVLIVGGAAQGKLDFAREKLDVTTWSDGVLGPESCVRSLHRAPREALAAWRREHPEGVLLGDEVGCGVTPLDRGEREWRELVGRICCELAERAQAVYRVRCGLGERLK